jgi:hypothetical protein
MAAAAPADLLRALAGVIHYYWLVKSDVRLPLMYGAILAVLMLYRLRWSGQAQARRRARAPPLPLRIRRPFQTSLIRSAPHVENAGLGLVHRVAGVLHDQLPGIVAMPVMGSMAPAADIRRSPDLQRLRRLLLVVGVLVDHRAQVNRLFFSTLSLERWIERV